MQLHKRTRHAEKHSGRRTPAVPSIPDTDRAIKTLEAANLSQTLWFTEKQLKPMLSPFWSWRLTARS